MKIVLKIMLISLFILLRQQSMEIKNFKINEKERLNPISPYSKSKLKLENFLIKNKKKISCIILRYFNVAGVDKKLRSGFYTKKVLI